MSRLRASFTLLLSSFSTRERLFPRASPGWINNSSTGFVLCVHLVDSTTSPPIYYPLPSPLYTGVERQASLLNLKKESPLFIFHCNGLIIKGNSSLSRYLTLFHGCFKSDLGCCNFNIFYYKEIRSFPEEKDKVTTT